MKKNISNQLKHAKNIGPTIEKRLNEIGVFCVADLAAITPLKAYKSICEQNPGKTIPMCYYLYSLQGALLDVHWNELPEQVKTELKLGVWKKSK